MKKSKVEFYGLHTDCGDGSFYLEVFASWDSAIEAIAEWADEARIDPPNEEELDREYALWVADDGRGFFLQRLGEESVQCMKKALLPK